MYRNVLEGEVFEASSPRVAEMEKILENTYRNVNIGLINGTRHSLSQNEHQHLGSHRSG